jgi:23S rRNA pseudouridine1911/1915/1917 synthase
VLVVAKNDWTQTALQKQFKDRSVERFYLAVVEGDFKQKTQKIQSYLARHPVDRKRYSSVRGEDKKTIVDLRAGFDRGKWAVTHVELIANHPARISYLKLKLETGRTHQIRVHLSEMGHPIVGDTLYGSKNKQKFPRFALHAASLTFTHPRSLEKLSFATPWPDDLSAYLKAWGFIRG